MSTTLIEDVLPLTGCAPQRRDTTRAVQDSAGKTYPGGITITATTGGTRASNRRVTVMRAPGRARAITN